MNKNRVSPWHIRLRLCLLDKKCSCWHIIDRNEGRSETIRRAPALDCPRCGGTGRLPFLLPKLRMKRKRFLAYLVFELFLIIGIVITSGLTALFFSEGRPDLGFGFLGLVIAFGGSLVISLNNVVFKKLF